jgi:hypothetical protein
VRCPKDTVTIARPGGIFPSDVPHVKPDSRINHQQNEEYFKMSSFFQNEIYRKNETIFTHHKQLNRLPGFADE